MCGDFSVVCMAVHDVLSSNPRVCISVEHLAQNCDLTITEHLRIALHTESGEQRISYMELCNTGKLLPCFGASFSKYSICRKLGV